MTFWGALYKLFIGPLELFFEIIFVTANEAVDNLGFSIIILSLVMNFLVLPLYKRADKMQEEQRETEKKLKRGVSHIKKTFKGDERFMMLQTYYRQNNYKPTSILKGSVSLLLEIPFFIAAYNFLSHTAVFNGYSFGPFADFSQPDGLIKIGTLSINLLPILMTAINIVSSIIYTKGLPVSSKVQLYGMAGIFLILLYDSPACLVFYWTLNNLFSLLKNIFYKLKNPKLVLNIMASAGGLAILIFVLFIHPMGTLKKQYGFIFISILLQLPILFYFLKKHIKSNKKEIELTKTDKLLFYSGIIFLALLTGLLIPSAVIKSSPEEFMVTLNNVSPLSYILQSVLIATGTFVIWFTIFYKLADKKSKRYMGLIVWIISVVAIVNYMFFGKNLGNISPLLVFDKLPEWHMKDSLFNILILVLASVAVFFIWKYGKEILKFVSLAVVVSVLGMGIFNCIKINKIVHSSSLNLQAKEDEKPVITLSKTGKNVMVFMMDRAINSYIPYIFNEKPEVAKQFAGFTYYPNTMSYGGHTNFGLPALFGGYEYTPKEMNKRNNELLEDKHNEALKVLPVLFDNEGFDVTVCDPSYAGYKWTPDLTVFDDYPDIKRYVTMGNKAISMDSEEYEKAMVTTLNRNFFVYSIMKSMPIIFQTFIYNKGQYCSLTVSNSQVCENIHEATGIDDLFMQSYKVLQKLPELTKVDSENNAFVMMCNDTSHEPCLLQTPDYTPEKVVNNVEYDNANKDLYTINGVTLKMNEFVQVKHYHVNMAAMIQLGKYFDYLREIGVYDNTRIIIVADHGYATNQLDDLRLGTDWDEDIMFYNPLLMMKDFNQTEFKEDRSFMTNGDVPTLATKDVIKNPVNPFTNNVIDNEAKNGKQYILNSRKCDVLKNNGAKYLEDRWYSVHDNIFDKNNWEALPVE